MIAAMVGTRSTRFRLHYLIFVILILWFVSAGAVAVSLSPGSSSSSVVIAKGDPYILTGLQPVILRTVCRSGLSGTII